MTNYTKINNWLGWLTFIISTLVYTVTLEQTSSFWDCGEFISSAYKLQVCHQPGAPLFLMISKVLSLFASSPETVAWWVNFGSALCSGATIMFLFWTITHIAKKLIVKDGDMSSNQMITIMSSGLIGALAFTFSDTFWYSAVEAEVYAMSSLCTAIVFWAILKWENEADTKSGDRWILFISYLMGLSIGIHLLNLLTIPALGLVYYFRKYKATPKGTVVAFLVSCLILVVIQYGIIPGTVSLAAKFDLFFVNTLGFSFGIGVFVFLGSLIGALVYAILYSIKTNNYWLNLASLCTTFILIGYASYAMIVIRAIADPPLNNNDPSNAYSFLSYLNREQYGDRPLLTGPLYNSPLVSQEEGAMMYRKGDTKYEEVGPRPISVHKNNTLFPRMYSDQPSHVQFYKNWENIKREPTFVDNISFFVSYQVNYMYFRYFLWNFAGRQNDIQGHGSINEGNWISGIPFLDAIRLDNQEFLPESITENKGYNRLYFLPLILGMLGLFYQYNRSLRGFSIVFMLFFMTGLAIVLYLNQTPIQPRERDYAYVGSFYAFAIWIGLGVIPIAEFLSKKIGNKAPALAFAIALIVPFIMLKEGWDDHNRSNRYMSRDLAIDYLNSCAPNAIVFTYGDNDTYPLWYCQEVEGIRPDIKLVNLSLLGTDWYGRQMKKKTNESAGLDISLSDKQFALGIRDYVPYFDQGIKEYIELKDVVSFMSSDDLDAKAQTNAGEFINFLPTKKLSISVDKATLVKNKMFTAADTALMTSKINWDLNSSGLYKNDLLVLDIIAQHFHNRPIYFAITVPDASYYGLQDYFRNEGFAYRLTPIKVTEENKAFSSDGFVNTDIMYDNLMNKFVWGNFSDPTIYIDPESARMASTCNTTFLTLAQACYSENKIDSCLNVLNKMNKEVPFIHTSLGYSLVSEYVSAELYYKCGKPEKAKELMLRTTNFIENELKYYHSLQFAMGSFKQEINFGLSLLMQLEQLAIEFKDEALAKELNSRATAQINKFEPYM